MRVGTERLAGHPAPAAVRLAVVGSSLILIGAHPPVLLLRDRQVARHELLLGVGGDRDQMARIPRVREGRRRGVGSWPSDPARHEHGLVPVAVGGVIGRGSNELGSTGLGQRAQKEGCKQEEAASVRQIRYSFLEEETNQFMPGLPCQPTRLFAILLAFSFINQPPKRSTWPRRAGSRPTTPASPRDCAVRSRERPRAFPLLR